MRNNQNSFVSQWLDEQADRLAKDYSINRSELRTKLNEFGGLFNIAGLDPASEVTEQTDLPQDIIIELVESANNTIYLGKEALNDPELLGGLQERYDTVAGPGVGSSIVQVLTEDTEDEESILRATNLIQTLSPTSGAEWARSDNKTKIRTAANMLKQSNVTPRKLNQIEQGLTNLEIREYDDSLIPLDSTDIQRLDFQSPIHGRIWANAGDGKHQQVKFEQYIQNLTERHENLENIGLVESDAFGDPVWRIRQKNEEGDPIDYDIRYERFSQGFFIGERGDSRMYSINPAMTMTSKKKHYQEKGKDGRTIQKHREEFELSDILSEAEVLENVLSDPYWSPSQWGIKGTYGGGQGLDRHTTSPSAAREIAKRVSVPSAYRSSIKQGFQYESVPVAAMEHITNHVNKKMAQARPNVPEQLYVPDKLRGTFLRNATAIDAMELTYQTPSLREPKKGFVAALDKFKDQKRNYREGGSFIGPATGVAYKDRHKRSNIRAEAGPYQAGQFSRVAFTSDRFFTGDGGDMVLSGKHRLSQLKFVPMTDKKIEELGFQPGDLWNRSGDLPSKLMEGQQFAGQIESGKVPGIDIDFRNADEVVFMGTREDYEYDDKGKVMLDSDGNPITRSYAVFAHSEPADIAENKVVSGMKGQGFPVREGNQHFAEAQRVSGRDDIMSIMAVPSKDRRMMAIGINALSALSAEDEYEFLRLIQSSADELDIPFTDVLKNDDDQGWIKFATEEANQVFAHAAERMIKDNTHSIQINEQIIDTYQMYEIMNQLGPGEARDAFLAQLTEEERAEIAPQLSEEGKGSIGIRNIQNIQPIRNPAGQITSFTADYETDMTILPILGDRLPNTIGGSTQITPELLKTMAQNQPYVFDKLATEIEKGAGKLTGQNKVLKSLRANTWEPGDGFATITRPATQVRDSIRDEYGFKNIEDTSLFQLDPDELDALITEQYDPQNESERKKALLALLAEETGNGFLQVGSTILPPASVLHSQFGINRHGKEINNLGNRAYNVISGYRELHPDYQGAETDDSEEALTRTDYRKQVDDYFEYAYENLLQSDSAVKLSFRGPSGLARSQAGLYFNDAIASAESLSKAAISNFSDVDRSDIYDRAMYGGLFGVGYMSQSDRTRTWMPTEYFSAEWLRGEAHEKLGVWDRIAEIQEGYDGENILGDAIIDLIHQTKHKISNAKNEEHQAALERRLKRLQLLQGSSSHRGLGFFGKVENGQFKSRFADFEVPKDAIVRSQGYIFGMDKDEDTDRAGTELIVPTITPEDVIGEDLFRSRFIHSYWDRAMMAVAHEGETLTKLKGIDALLGGEDRWGGKHTEEHLEDGFTNLRAYQGMESSYRGLITNLYSTSQEFLRQLDKEEHLDVLDRVSRVGAEVYQNFMKMNADESPSTLGMIAARRGLNIMNQPENMSEKTEYQLKPFWQSPQSGHHYDNKTRFEEAAFDMITSYGIGISNDMQEDADRYFGVNDYHPLTGGPREGVIDMMATALLRGQDIGEDHQTEIEDNIKVVLAEMFKRHHEGNPTGGVYDLGTDTIGDWIQDGDSGALRRKDTPPQWYSNDPELRKRLLAAIFNRDVADYDNKKELRSDLRRYVLGNPGKLQESGDDAFYHKKDGKTYGSTVVDPPMNPAVNMSAMSTWLMSEVMKNTLRFGQMQPENKYREAKNIYHAYKMKGRGDQNPRWPIVKSPMQDKPIMDLTTMVGSVGAGWLQKLGRIGIQSDDMAGFNKVYNKPERLTGRAHRALAPDPFHRIISRIMGASNHLELDHDGELLQQKLPGAAAYLTLDPDPDVQRFLKDTSRGDDELFNYAWNLENPKSRERYDNWMKSQGVDYKSEGGGLSKDGITIVGEEGPEIIIDGEHVLPNEVYDRIFGNKTPTTLKGTFPDTDYAAEGTPAVQEFLKQAGAFPGEKALLDQFMKDVVGLEDYDGRNLQRTGLLDQFKDYIQEIDFPSASSLTAEKETEKIIRGTGSEVEPPPGHVLGRRSREEPPLLTDEDLRDRVPPPEQTEDWRPHKSRGALMSHRPGKSRSDKWYHQSTDDELTHGYQRLRQAILDDTIAPISVELARRGGRKGALSESAQAAAEQWEQDKAAFVDPPSAEELGVIYNTFREKYGNTMPELADALSMAAGPPADERGVVKKGSRPSSSAFRGAGGGAAGGGGGGNYGAPPYHDGEPGGGGSGRYRGPNIDVISRTEVPNISEGDVRRFVDTINEFDRLDQLAESYYADGLDPFDNLEFAKQYEEVAHEIFRMQSQYEALNRLGVGPEAIGGERWSEMQALMQVTTDRSGESGSRFGTYKSRKTLQAATDRLNQARRLDSERMFNDPYKAAERRYQMGVADEVTVPELESLLESLSETNIQNLPDDNRSQALWKAEQLLGAQDYVSNRLKLDHKVNQDPEMVKLFNALADRRKELDERGVRAESPAQAFANMDDELLGSIAAVEEFREHIAILGEEDLPKTNSEMKGYIQTFDTLSKIHADYEEEVKTLRNAKAGGEMSLSQFERLGELEDQAYPMNMLGNLLNEAAPNVGAARTTLRLREARQNANLSIGDLGDLLHAQNVMGEMTPENIRDIIKSLDEITPENLPEDGKSQILHRAQQIESAVSTLQKHGLDDLIYEDDEQRGDMALLSASIAKVKGYGVTAKSPAQARDEGIQVQEYIPDPQLVGSLDALSQFTDQISTLGDGLPDTTREMKNFIGTFKVASDVHRRYTEEVEALTKAVEQGEATPQQIERLTQLASRESEMQEVGQYLEAAAPDIGRAQTQIQMDKFADMSEEEQESLMMHWMSNRGMTGRRQRAHEDYDRLVEDWFQRRTGGRLSGERGTLTRGAFEVGGQMLRTIRSLQGMMFAGMMASNQIINPMATWAGQYETLMSSRENAAIQMQPTSFEEMMTGTIGARRRRAGMMAGFNEALGGEIYNTWAPVLSGGENAMGIGRGAGFLASVGGPAVAAAMIGTQLGTPLTGLVTGMGAAAVGTAQYVQQRAGEPFRRSQASFDAMRAHPNLDRRTAMLASGDIGGWITDIASPMDEEEMQGYEEFQEALTFPIHGGQNFASEEINKRIDDQVNNILSDSMFMGFDETLTPDLREYFESGQVSDALQAEYERLYSQSRFSTSGQTPDPHILEAMAIRSSFEPINNQFAAERGDPGTPPPQFDDFAGYSRNQIPELETIDMSAFENFSDYVDHIVEQYGGKIEGGLTQSGVRAMLLEQMQQENYERGINADTTQTSLLLSDLYGGETLEEGMDLKDRIERISATTGMQFTPDMIGELAKSANVSVSDRGGIGEILDRYLRLFEDGDQPYQITNTLQQQSRQLTASSNQYRDRAGIDRIDPFKYSNPAWADASNTMKTLAAENDAAIGQVAMQNREIGQVMEGRTSFDQLAFLGQGDSHGLSLYNERIGQIGGLSSNYAQYAGTDAVIQEQVPQIMQAIAMGLEEADWDQYVSALSGDPRALTILNQRARQRGERDGIAQEMYNQMDLDTGLGAYEAGISGQELQGLTDASYNPQYLSYANRGIVDVSDGQLGLQYQQYTMNRGMELANRQFQMDMSRASFEFTTGQTPRQPSTPERLMQYFSGDNRQLMDRMEMAREQAPHEYFSERLSGAADQIGGDNVLTRALRGASDMLNKFTAEGEPAVDTLKDMREIMDEYGDYNIGRSQWEIEDDFRRLSREQQRFGMGQQQESLGLEEAGRSLRWRHFFEQLGFDRERSDYGIQKQRTEMDIGRQQQLRRRSWQFEDWSFNRSQMELGFGWQMEDFDLNLRYARGMQRRQLMRQQERAVITQSMNRAQSDRQYDRMEETAGWEDEAFERQQEYFNKEVEFTERAFEMRERHFREQWALEDRNFEMKRERLQKELQWMQQQWALEDEQIQNQREWYVFQFEAQQQQMEVTNQVKDAMFALESTMKGVAEGSDILAKNLQNALQTMQAFADISEEYKSASVSILDSAKEAFAALASNSNTVLGQIASGISSAIGVAQSAAQTFMQNMRQMQINRTMSNLMSIPHGGSKPTLVAYDEGGYVPPMLPSYDEGGYTGSGFKKQVAGIVHGGEYVVPQDGALVMKESDMTVEELREIRKLMQRLVDMGIYNVNATINTNSAEIRSKELSPYDAVYRKM